MNHSLKPESRNWHCIYHEPLLEAEDRGVVTESNTGGEVVIMSNFDAVFYITVTLVSFTGLYSVTLLVTFYCIG